MNLKGLILVAILSGVGYLFYVGYQDYKLNKYKKLDGVYQIHLSSLQRLPNLIAVITYRGFGDGNFDVDKLTQSHSENDLWDSLSDEEIRTIKREIREYFWKLRGHGPVAR